VTAKGAVLYIAQECDTVSDAQASLRRFIDAGLNTESDRVHVSIGEADTLHTTTEQEASE
jgi:hypothetical protein